MVGAVTVTLLVWPGLKDVVVLCEKVRCGVLTVECGLVLVLVLTADYGLCLCHSGSMGVALSLSLSRSLSYRTPHLVPHCNNYTDRYNNTIQHCTSLVMLSL